MTSPYSIYIPIGITYKKYKAEYFAAYIDSGAGGCMCRPQCFPQEYHQDLPKITGRDISENTFDINRGIEKPIILLGSFLIKCPPFYFYNMGSDILLGNNFLQLFSKIIFDTALYQIRFKTPCQHWIVVRRLKRAFSRKFPIEFQSRATQRGEKDSYFSKPIFSDQPLLRYQTLFKTLDLEIEYIRNKLKNNFSENPLQFWEKNKIEAKLELKDKNKITRVPPMRYNPEDKKEFDKQIQELINLRLIRSSNSPHSSPAFMVRNHAEIVRNKARMVINYKKLNDNTVFDGYFLPHKDSLINWTKGKRMFSKFDCKSGFW